MADRSRIEWTDRTWNPVTGCDKVSPGCDHCYAEAIARRFAGSAAFPSGFALTLHPGRLGAPPRWRRPSRVFVNSMADLFHPGVPEGFIARVFAVMASTPQHTYQVLTKRHARMRALLGGHALRDAVREAASPGCGWPLPNVWLGVSIEDQKRADLRLPALLGTPAAVRFVSCEPLLGPVNLTWAAVSMGNQPGHGRGAPYRHTGACCARFHGLDWVIAGGESGPGARPMHPDWVRSLRDQCQPGRVAFFFKQWGQYAPAAPGGSSGSRALVGPFGTRYDPRQASTAPPDAVLMARVHAKHTAGRVLDGRTWDEFPEVAR